MAKFVCTVCGYVYEGEAAPAECPICHAPAEKFVKQEGEMTWASEHVVGVAKGVSEDILADLRISLTVGNSCHSQIHTNFRARCKICRTSW